jgi:uncharacterized protein (TIGR02145 family)
MKKTIKISVLVLFVILVIIACKKEKIDNPTNGKTNAVFNPDLTYGTMTDQDGNEYKTITIGTQTWMAENLRTTKYSDGTTIPNVTDNTAWTNLTTGAYCNYNNTTSADTIATYGRLYNWYAAIGSGNIAPAGWHVPTETEWRTLIYYLGGFSVAGGKMKETGTTHWINPNIGATNESGFTALPSGARSDLHSTPIGKFAAMGYFGYYWSSTPIDTNYYLLPLVSHLEAMVGQTGFYIPNGFAVRLIKD